MGLIQAFSGAIGGTFADQWKDIVTVGQFDEHMVVGPGLLQARNNGRGANYNGSAGVISNGSKIFVPENTAAFIFDKAGIKEVITEPGGYEYQSGESSIFNGEGIKKSIFKQATERFTYGGQAASDTKIAFVNLREIRDIRFGTPSPILYNDLYYGTDLEITAYGSMSIKVVNPDKFIRNYLPANVMCYSFDDEDAKSQIISEFLQSFIVALNSLSTQYRISQLASQSGEIVEKIVNDPHNAGTWEERFGFKIINISIRNIEMSEESKKLVKQYSANKMNVKAYDDVSQRTSNIGAQQKIAQGIENHGLGDGAGMILGMNMAQSMGAQAETKSNMSIDQQIETLKKLKDLVDAGILTEEEFNIKKKEIMNL